jgi:molybdenum cofactor cytidylyltransferase
MNLLKALRLGPCPRLALVGAGGKTTALFQLAREYQAAGASTVLLAASAHLAIEQLGQAEACFEIGSSKAIIQLGKSLTPGIVLLHGGQVETGRVGGLAAELLVEVRALADQARLPLLVEADGSRRRPLKAPSEHEPPIPEWVDTVLVLAGLSGVDRPLTNQWVHRPEIFSLLSGLEPGALVSLDGLARVLTDPNGGLKNIPGTARRVALLNQADTPGQQAAGARLAERLLDGGFQAGLVAALDPPNEQDRIPARGVFLVRERNAGIVLAAGAASRFGQPKQILPWRGEALVRHAARAGLEAGLRPVVVVTGSYADQVQATLGDLPVVIVHNPDWESGQSSSLAAGLRSLPEACGGALFLLADQPQIPASLVRALADRHAETLAPILAPLVDGQRGNPVFFDRQTFGDLLALQGDTGGRALFSRWPVEWLPWHDASVLMDIDRLEDYQRFSEPDTDKEGQIG